jgi:hypothetical protein
MNMSNVKGEFFDVIEGAAETKARSAAAHRPPSQHSAKVHKTNPQSLD